MNYISGEKIKVGDKVRIERGRTPGVVEHIIESEQDMKEWGLDEQGLLLLSEPLGSVFWPLSETYDPVIFVSRGVT